MSMTKMSKSALSVAAIVLALSGCSGNATETKETPLPPPAVVGRDGVEGAKDALTTSDCSSKGGKWAFSGTLTNRDAAKQTYTVRVAITGKGSATVAAKQFTETLDPKATKDLSDAAVADVAADQQCVVSVTKKKA